MDFNKQKNRFLTTKIFHNGLTKQNMREPLWFVPIELTAVLRQNSPAIMTQKIRLQYLLNSQMSYLKTCQKILNKL